MLIRETRSSVSKYNHTKAALPLLLGRDHDGFSTQASIQTHVVQGRTLDINNLIAFIAVAEKKSFSRSADSLNLTQPAVSKRVAALETELATKLFDRIGRTIHLTEAGRMLLPSAKQISAELSRIENVICSLGDEVSGTLSLGTTEQIATYRLPEVLKTFHAQYPTVELNLNFASSELTLAALESGLIELAFCSFSAKDTAKFGTRFKHHEIWKDDLVVVTANDHPLAQEASVNLQQLSTYPAVLPPETAPTRKIIDDAFKKLQLRPQLSMEVANIATIRAMTAVSFGWTYLPESLAESLSTIRVAELKESQSVTLITQSERTLSNSALALIELLPIKTNIENVKPAAPPQKPPEKTN